MVTPKQHRGIMLSVPTSLLFVIIWVGLAYVSFVPGVANEPLAHPPIITEGL